MCWWAFTGLTHMILEGYFVFSPEFYKDKTGFYLAEVCESFTCSLTLPTHIALLEFGLPFEEFGFIADERFVFPGTINREGI